MTTTPCVYRAPRWSLLHTEAIRAATEGADYLCSLPDLLVGSRGDGHDVLVLPGLLAGDSSTAALRLVLKAQGFAPHAWRQGVNIGPTRMATEAVHRAIEHLSDRAGAPISLVGWSLGGILAREFARAHPDRIRTVITLGSPFRLTAEHSPSSTHAGWAYEALRPWHTELLEHGRAEEEQPPLTMPTTSIYSRTDGIVPWRACQSIPGEQHENIEVSASHFGLGVQPGVIRIVLDRLAQPIGGWRPYQATAAAA